MNLQNIPSLTAYRKAFSCPDNWKIVNADYSGQETVILANRSGEKNMIELINNQGDMHSFVASNLYSEPYQDYLNMLIKKESNQSLTIYEKELIKHRQIAKAAGLTYFYKNN